MADIIGGAAGAVVIFLILVALAGYMYWRAQQQKVDANNVNAEWDEKTGSIIPPETAVAAKAETEKV